MAESFRGRKGIIIGGGASGLMAAITAAKQGADVTVLEHTARPGKKILSTGNGKCNLTNLYMDPSCYRSDQSGFVHGQKKNIWNKVFQKKNFGVMKTIKNEETRS